MKKLFQAWVQGQFSRETKLAGRAITVINTKILSLQEYCPSDFARRPKSLELYSKYKVTELRQFLLYTGPAILHDLLDDRVYKHFLFLHIAIRILASTSPVVLCNTYVLQNVLFRNLFCNVNIYMVLHFIFIMSTDFFI